MQKNLKQQKTLIQLALEEDVCKQAILQPTTSFLLKPDEKPIWLPKPTESSQACQLPKWFFRQLDENLVWEPQVDEGAQVITGTILVRFEASYRALLTAERTALNFFQRLSGIASMSAKYADAVKGSKTVILDTRKNLAGISNA